VAEIKDGQLDDFIRELTKLGGRSGNSNLRKRLNWGEDTYWTAQGQLVEKGKILIGRGRGGSVRLVQVEIEVELAQPLKSEKKDTSRRSERDLYTEQFLKSVENWIKRFGLDRVLVEGTHSRGSKRTGGTFSRPDVTVVGQKQYIYLPQRLEIFTFEVKPKEAVSILGVLEALAHREASHRAYVLYAVSGPSFIECLEADRIVELAQKYGVGIITAENPDNLEQWEVQLDAVRHEPNPERLDRFLIDLPDGSLKTNLSKWK
jgi:hypothetical protein